MTEKISLAAQASSSRNLDRDVSRPSELSNPAVSVLDTQLIIFPGSHELGGSNDWSRC